MKCRKVQDDVETRGNSLTWDEPGGWPDFCPGGIRHKGGVTLNLTESESRGPPPLRINYAVRFGHQQGGAGMNLRSVDRSKSRFAAYVEGLVSVIGHADRASP